MREWLDIETAPQTGQWIWLANSHSMRIGWWSSNSGDANHGTVGGGWIDMAMAEAGGMRGLRFAPTHWMELPSPPHILAEGAER